jgi:hypothetical protein
LKEATKKKEETGLPASKSPEPQQTPKKKPGFFQRLLGHKDKNTH